MMLLPADSLNLQIGGAINARTSVYIDRHADDELLRLLEQGEYCNVLCSRQMGKTSLLKRTQSRLAERGYTTVDIDVAGYLGAPPDPNEWYQGLLQDIVRQGRFQVDVGAWWQACAAFTPNQRLIQFFRDEIITKVSSRVVIFLDEIDSTRRLPYTDDFFVAIRSIYNDRASEPAYKRLTFCLVGVATPNELIKDSHTTPYNVGKTIELQDFDLEHDDLGPLYRAVSEDTALGQEVVTRVLSWTGGHPYLTLYVCNEFISQHRALPDDVDRLTHQSFSDLEALRTNVHFQEILRFLNERMDNKQAALSLYRRILRGEQVHDQALPIHMDLKLGCRSHIDV
jgi:hypothetical protein